ncbi:DUF4870 domain-containing protein [Butyrivibrio sp. AE2032]|uniref:DUF4870 domain-containing protein n=1 Tax=Butyrivibrio sp. AE2032 TaxID=1458463 RepID=UPI000556E63C|nr:hypothetical protein [Butyrivibrio sp. AE2032]
MAENQNAQAQGGPYTEQLPSNAKLFSILAYIGLLWLLGLLISPEKTSPFVRNHVNNGILLLIMEGIAGVVGTLMGLIPYVGWLFELALWGCCVAVMVMGIVAAAKTKYFSIPVIGDKIKIVK